MTKKNIVFMLDIDIQGDGRYSSTRRLPYKYSIESWKAWCNKNNCELFVLNDLLLSNKDMGICWPRIGARPHDYIFRALYQWHCSP